MSTGSPASPHSRKEAGEIAERQSGGPGRCTGRGRISGISNSWNAPLWRNGASVQTRSRMETVSAMRARESPLRRP